MKSGIWGLRFILAISIGIIVFSCRRNGPTLEIAQLVKTVKVKGQSGDFSITYPGIIKAAADVKLSFRVAGPIQKVWVKEGEYVRKGALLAQLDPRDYQLQYDAAAAAYKQVKGETDRIIELYQQNSVAENEYDKAVAAQKQAWALYHARLNALEDTRLKAPFSGYIQEKYFDSYEIVNQGTPVVSMIDDDYLEVDVDIPATDFIRSSDFQDYYAKVDIYPDTLVRLEFMEISQQANFNQLFRARFRLKRDKKLLLAPGMSASVIIRYKPDAERLSVIPISALVEEKGYSYVWQVKEGQDRIWRIPVEVRRIMKDGMVIVSSALEEGDRIVSAGVNTLKDGQRVRILPPPGSSNVGHLL